MKRLASWLASVPGRDLVERRQAYLLQAFLLIVATAFVFAALGNGFQMLTGGRVLGSVLPNLEAAAILGLLVAALRRGWFRPVAGLTVVFLVYAFAQALAGSSTTLAGSYLALLMLPLVLAGLVLPRLGLLATAIAVAVAGQLALRANPGAIEAGLLDNGGNFLFAVVLVAAVVDQFGGTVRSALLNALVRERELEIARANLQARTGELQHAVLALETEMAERQRLESERRAMETRVLELQKLESLGLLAGGVAHDFNNLLVGILGNAGLALLEQPPGTPGRDRIGEIETASRRASDLARQMLAYSGKGRLMVAPVDLSQLVREMIELLRASIGRGIDVRYALSEDRVVIEGDATQLRQVVMNLVVNASDAIGDRRGTITVATGRVHADRAYLSGTFVDEGLAEGEYAVLDVSDTGSGMDPETQTRIFDPFFTTKTSGRGLGLAAVLGIVRAHHGALKVYSERDRGSTFKLLLPVTDADAQPDPWANRSATPWHGEGTVLVVDDEAMVRDVAEAILARLGLSVVQAADGEEAVRLYEAEPDRFDVVLVDLTMPRLSGAETFRRIRALRPEARVILMSGYNEEEASGSFAGKGLSGFLEKPFSTQALGELVGRVLGAPGQGDPNRFAPPPGPDGEA